MNQTEAIINVREASIEGIKSAGINLTDSAIKGMAHNRLLNEGLDNAAFDLVGTANAPLAAELNGKLEPLLLKQMGQSNIDAKAMAQITADLASMMPAGSVKDEASAAKAADELNRQVAFVGRAAIALEMDAATFSTSLTGLRKGLELGQKGAEELTRSLFSVSKSADIPFQELSASVAKQGKRAQLAGVKGADVAALAGALRSAGADAKTTDAMMTKIFDVMRAPDKLDKVLVGSGFNAEQFKVLQKMDGSKALEILFANIYKQDTADKQDSKDKTKPTLGSSAAVLDPAIFDLAKESKAASETGKLDERYKHRVSNSETLKQQMKDKASQANAMSQASALNPLFDAFNNQMVTTFGVLQEHPIFSAVLGAGATVAGTAASKAGDELLKRGVNKAFDWVFGKPSKPAGNATPSVDGAAGNMDAELRRTSRLSYRAASALKALNKQLAVTGRRRTSPTARRLSLGSFPNQLGRTQRLAYAAANALRTLNRQLARTVLGGGGGWRSKQRRRASFSSGFRGVSYPAPFNPSTGSASAVHNAPYSRRSENKNLANGPSSSGRGSWFKRISRKIPGVGTALGLADLAAVIKNGGRRIGQTLGDLAGGAGGAAAGAAAGSLIFPVVGTVVGGVLGGLAGGELGSFIGKLWDDSDSDSSTTKPTDQNQKGKLSAPPSQPSTAPAIHLAPTINISTSSLENEDQLVQKIMRQLELMCQQQLPQLIPQSLSTRIDHSLEATP